MTEAVKVYPTYEPGEIVNIKGDDWVFNGRALQNTRGRNLLHAIQTLSSIFFWPLDPHISEVRTVDIAHHLSIESRFANTPPFPYSVAWHSYVLSHIVPEHLQKWALIHDATEAYLIDVPRPMKRVEPFKTFYEKAERALMVPISKYFKMEDTVIPKELKYYDVLIGNTELITLMGDVGLAKLRIQQDEDYINECQKLKGWVREMYFADAREAWLTRFEELFGTTAEEFDRTNLCPKLEL